MRWTTPAVTPVALQQSFAPRTFGEDGYLGTALSPHNALTPSGGPDDTAIFQRASNAHLPQGIECPSIIRERVRWLQIPDKHHKKKHPEPPDHM
jgi:hypothetical protein